MNQQKPAEWEKLANKGVLCLDGSVNSTYHHRDGFISVDNLRSSIIADAKGCKLSFMDETEEMLYVCGEEDPSATELWRCPFHRRAFELMGIQEDEVV